MKTSKYYYNDIPLSIYCKENGINIDTVRTRIWKKRHNPKYDKYTDQEIVDMVVEASGTSIKYYYKGISLREYCLKNNINFSTIYSRISKLKEKYPELSFEELPIIAIEDFSDNNFKYFYQGMPLITYCTLNPSIKYRTIQSFIQREKTKNPDLSYEEIIDLYISKEHKGIYKYYYLGIPLKKYCDENNINYKNIISFISRCKGKKEYTDLTNDEFIELVMNNYETFNPKYLYQNDTLFNYCKNHNISYYSVVSYVKRKIKKGSNKSVDELISDAINTINRYGIIYYYEGMPLVEYASLHHLNISSIRMSIIRKKVDTNKDLQDIINDAVKEYVKYFYKGIPLSSYCLKNNISYQMVMAYYNRYYKDKDNLSFEDAITIIINKVKDKPLKKDKYFYKEMYLSEYCKKNGYNYDNVLARIELLSKKDPGLSNDELVKIVLDKYRDKVKIRNVNNVFTSLNGKNNSKKGICNKLNISYNNVQELIDMGFSFEQSVKIIWFFSDKTISGRKIITDIKLEEIYRFINYIDTLIKQEEIKKLDFYSLYAVYKCELYDARELIIKREESYLTKLIFDFCKAFNLNVNAYNFDDFYVEAQIILLKILDKTYSNVSGRFIKYVDLSVKGYFRQYLKKYKESTLISNSKRTIRLDENYYKNESRNITYGDVIGFNDNNTDDVNLSDDMLKLLSNLSKEDQKYVFLRFCENYSLEELVEYYKVSLEDLRKKEEEILSLLRKSSYSKTKKLI